MHDLQAKLLSMIFGKSWESDEIPRDWKKGNIVPIFIKGEKEHLGNYWSVLTSVPGKIMEQTLPEAMLRHMGSREVIQDIQHDLIKGTSCVTNLVAFYEKANTLVDKGRANDVIYLVFCKAFDTVLHNILFSRLQRQIYEWADE